MKKSILTFAVLLFGIFLVGCSDTKDTSYEEDMNMPVPQTTDSMENDGMDTTESEAQETTTEASLDTPPTETNTAATITPPLTPESPVMNPTAAVEDPQTSQVIFPNGGELMEVGKAYTIRWESEGIEAVDISLIANGREVAVLGTRILAYNGVLEWTPTADILGGASFAQFTIGMTDSDTGKKHDTSDKPFIVQIKETE